MTFLTRAQEHFANCIREIKKESSNTTIELLIPDFKGDRECLGTIVSAKPEVIGHNIETVERLSLKIRDGRAKYSQSLAVLRAVKELDSRIYTKSAMMLGLGETEGEIIQSMKDLRDAGVDFLAIGQYLRPTNSQMDVQEYIRPEVFASLREKALQLGFLYVAAGPFVRSSYKAGEFFTKRILENRAAIC